MSSFVKADFRAQSGWVTVLLIALFLTKPALSAIGLDNPNIEILEDGYAHACNFGIEGSKGKGEGLDHASASVVNLEGGVGYRETLTVKPNQSLALFQSVGQPNAVISNLVFSFSTEHVGTRYFIDFCLKPNTIQFKPGLPGQGQGGGGAAGNSGQNQSKPSPHPQLSVSYHIDIQLMGVSLGQKNYWQVNRLGIEGFVQCLILSHNPQDSSQNKVIPFQYSFSNPQFQGNFVVSTPIPNQSTKDQLQSCVARVYLSEKAIGIKRSHQQQVEFTALLDLIPN